ncbi:MAG: ATP-binding cassette domain-containing protein, partial [Mesorhizobium sp.]
MTAALLEARGLGATANGRALVDNVSLSMAAGGRLAIIGPNGAGKTTFVSLLSGRIR